MSLFSSATNSLDSGQWRPRIWTHPIAGHLTQARAILTERFMHGLHQDVTVVKIHSEFVGRDQQHKIDLDNAPLQVLIHEKKCRKGRCVFHSSQTGGGGDEGRRVAVCGSNQHSQQAVPSKMWRRERSCFIGEVVTSNVHVVLSSTWAAKESTHRGSISLQQAVVVSSCCTPHHCFEGTHTHFRYRHDSSGQNILWKPTVPSLLVSNHIIRCPFYESRGWNRLRGTHCASHICARSMKTAVCLRGQNSKRGSRQRCNVARLLRGK